jgi:hypothetical protein
MCYERRRAEACVDVGRLSLYLPQVFRPGDVEEAVARERIVVEVQPPARPSDARVNQRGDKANGVRQRGNAGSGAHCMLGVTSTGGRRAMTRQPRSRFCCC